MRLNIIKSFAIIGLVFGMSACASQDEQMKLHSLEEKVNQALMNSAAAKLLHLRPLCHSPARRP